WALTAEPVDADVDTLRLKFRRALVDEMEKRITAAVVAGHLPDLDPRFAAPAVVGAVLEGVVGPLAPSGGATREAVQTTTLLALRALGVLDARARGLVAQYALP
ncbi:MAG: TetR/AcrR family transcriptional regulator, partial [Pseudolabrys sp.]